MIRWNGCLLVAALLCAGCPQEQQASVADAAPQERAAPGETSGVEEPAEGPVEGEAIDEPIDEGQGDDAAPEPTSDEAPSLGLFDDLAGELEVDEVDFNIGVPSSRNPEPSGDTGPDPADPWAPMPTPRARDRERTGNRSGSLTPRVETISTGEAVDVRQHLRPNVRTVVEFGAEW
jgi:hypothetical protein